MINFRNVDKENFHAVIELEMHEDQMGEKSGFKLTGAVYKSEPGRIERGTKNENRYYEVVRRRYYSN